MKKKNGFTLIELLAVIVVLAIIALIAVPIILGVIEKAKKGSAESAAYGFIDAVEKQIAINQVKGENFITDGEYSGDGLDIFENIAIKGKKPVFTEDSIIKISKSQIGEASFCIMDYRISYAGGKAVAQGKCDEDPIPTADQITFVPRTGDLTSEEVQCDDSNWCDKTTVASALDYLNEVIK